MNDAARRAPLAVPSVRTMNGQNPPHEASPRSLLNPDTPRHAGQLRFYEVPGGLSSPLGACSRAARMDAPMVRAIRIGPAIAGSGSSQVKTG